VALGENHVVPLIQLQLRYLCDETKTKTALYFVQVVRATVATVGCALRGAQLEVHIAFVNARKAND